MRRKEFKMQSKGSSKKKLALKISLLLALSLLLSLTAYGVYLTKKVEHAANNAYEVAGQKGSTLRENEVKPVSDNVSILFIGVDNSEVRDQGERNTRTDALMVATLNNKDKSVKLLSIPRDSYVYIPEAGYEDKITHAYGHGGTRVTIETVEELLEIPIDYYVKMDFNAFIDVVDSLGGITVDVPFDRLEKDENDRKTIQLTEGLQTLDGRHALALARTRYVDNDIERGKRQQMILEAVIDKATSASSFTKYGDVIDAVGGNMKTDMTFDEMTSFFNYLKGGKPQIDSLSLTGDDDMSTGTYYWILDEEDLEETRDILKAHLGLTTDTSNLSDGSSSIQDTTQTAQGQYDDEE